MSVYYPKYPRVFIAYVWYTHWSLLAIGISIDIKQPNIEIHLPCCFIRMGLSTSIDPKYKNMNNYDRQFGFLNFPKINKQKLAKAIGYIVIAICLIGLIHTFLTMKGII